MPSPIWDMNAGPLARVVLNYLRRRPGEWQFLNRGTQQNCIVCAYMIALPVEPFSLLSRKSPDSALMANSSPTIWNRSWKIRPIEQENPTWRDLYEDII